MKDVSIIIEPLPKASSTPSPPPTHPSSVKPEGQTPQASRDGAGSSQNAEDRRWEGGKEVSCRAGKQGPATSRALIS